MDCSPTGSFVHGIIQGRILGGLPFPPPGDLSDPETESASPASAVSQAGTLLVSQQGSPVSGLREARSSLESTAPSPEKGGMWCLPGTVADALQLPPHATSPSKQRLPNSLQS